MAIKDELLSSAVDNLGTYLHSAIDIFLNTLQNKDQQVIQTKAELLESEDVDAIETAEEEYDSEQVTKFRLQKPLLFMNRKIVVCPECGNYDERYLCEDSDKIACLKCGHEFIIKYTDTSGESPLLKVNGNTVSCPKCMNNNASMFIEDRNNLTCSICDQSFSIANTLLEDGLLLFY